MLTGGIDVMILETNDRTKIDWEMRTKLQLARGRKYIYHSDHSIPPSMSLDSYRFAMDFVSRYGDR